jgi:mannose-6-phosphate isomerase
LSVRINFHFSIRYLVANRYFVVELFDVNGLINQDADGSKFQIYLLTEGAGEIKFRDGVVPVKRGESLLIPATLGSYTMEGNFKALKAYVPDLTKDVLTPLEQAGYTHTEIFAQVGGLK